MEEKYSESFNENFCIALELQLSSALNNSSHRIFKHFWCDGIKWAPFVEHKANLDYLSIENVLTRKFIKTDAWFGESGQENYAMKIYLSPHALKLYQKGQNLNETIPESSDINWVKIDTRKKKIKIKLL